MATELPKSVEDALPLAVSKEANVKTDKYSKTAGQDVGYPNFAQPDFNNKYEERDYIKGRLAAAYRVFGHFGLNEGIDHSAGRCARRTAEALPDCRSH